MICTNQDIVRIRDAHHDPVTVADVHLYPAGLVRLCLICSKIDLDICMARCRRTNEPVVVLNLTNHSRGCCNASSRRSRTNAYPEPMPTVLPEALTKTALGSNTYGGRCYPFIRSCDRYQMEIIISMHIGRDRRNVHAAPPTLKIAKLELTWLRVSSDRRFAAARYRKVVVRSEWPSQRRRVETGIPASL
jgi:hypothetical protein